MALQCTEAIHFNFADAADLQQTRASSPAYVASWEHLVIHCVKQDAGLDGPLA